MKRFTFSGFALVLLFVMAFLTAGPANADKPSWAGGKHAGDGKHKEHRNQPRYSSSRHDDHGGKTRYEKSWQSYRGGRYFNDRDRTYVRNYYHHEFQRGFCPPGLAKKHNGCMPPGQAKKWVIGRPLPRGVVYYNLPSPLAMSMGVPPPGYKYVRVASDILMIAVGTGIIADAINDLGRY